MAHWSHYQPLFLEARTQAAWLGRRAERAAARYLVRRGMRVVARNYRTRAGELDLVMRHDDELVFVEVRYRSDSTFGDGAATVDRNKQQRLIRAAEHYLVRHDASNSPCRFDVVSVSGPNYRLRLEWIRNAFTP